MNSMNYISSIPRSRSFGSSNTKESPSHADVKVEEIDDAPIKLEEDAGDIPFTWTSNSITSEPEQLNEGAEKLIKQESDTERSEILMDEKTPLLAQAGNGKLFSVPGGTATTGSLSRRIVGSVLGTLKVVVSTILAPGRYLVACFYDEEGRFSAMMPVYRIRRKLSRRQRKKEAKNARSKQEGQRPSSGSRKNSRQSTSMSEHLLYGSNMSGTVRNMHDADDTPARHTRSKTATPTPPLIAEDADAAAAATKRSPRIRILNADSLRHRKQGSPVSHGAAESAQEPPLTAATIKSPTSPTSSLRLTRYPRAPAPPRPLIPRRQPSYAATSNPSMYNGTQKTLIIDLDETLIHSMAKGGRMSTGHMVEVKLQSPMGSGGTIMAPQVPILYYVHKRPNCDEFLRKVSKWYNLIVFTASVQEYADPVIDWLELERKYFSARYYRQHCTYRNGAYIKDLTTVEPDLSKVMILDNSPVSYIFHEDNAIPIEGWISDPTDNDLLHLIPFLEGLQYATDVRALLALRLGEAVSTTPASPITA